MNQNLVEMRERLNTLIALSHMNQNLVSHSMVNDYRNRCWHEIAMAKSRHIILS